ncbi:MAG: flagellar FliJ family protein [bacterium]|nr:flagellar FliJ family protein [bacterium]
MRRFRFRLERVLRYRETREGIAYRALQDAVRQRVQLEMQIRALAEQMRQIAEASIRPEEWSPREQTLAAMATRLQRLQDTLPLLQEQEAHAREVYLQARRERDALTQLRIRAYEQHQHEIQRLVQNEVDEAAVYAYQRRLSEDASTGSGD